MLKVMLEKLNKMHCRFPPIIHVSLTWQLLRKYDRQACTDMSHHASLKLRGLEPIWYNVFHPKPLPLRSIYQFCLQALVCLQLWGLNLNKPNEKGTKSTFPLWSGPEKTNYRCDLSVLVHYWPLAVTACGSLTVTERSYHDFWRLSSGKLSWINPND